jgi:uncharacterized protein RhaS with RHS repeats
MYYYKARIYAPSLGRFMQPDPIGYGDGMNMYNYVGSDPVNGMDPMGLKQVKIMNGKVYVLTCVDGQCGWTFAGYSPTNNASPGEAIDRRGKPSVSGEEESPQKGLLDDILDTTIDLYCSLPSIGGGVTAGGYAGLGGGVSFDIAFDPQTGRLGISGGLNVGVGVGFSVAGNGTLSAGRSVPNGVSGSVGVNASVRVPGARVGVAGTLINNKGFNPSFNGVSAGLAPGVGLTANANLTARGGIGGQVLPSCK